MEPLIGFDFRRRSFDSGPVRILLPCPDIPHFPYHPLEEPNHQGIELGSDRWADRTRGGSPNRRHPQRRRVDRGGSLFSRECGRRWLYSSRHRRLRDQAFFRKKNTSALKNSSQRQAWQSSTILFSLGLRGPMYSDSTPPGPGQTSDRGCNELGTIVTSEVLRHPSRHEQIHQDRRHPHRSHRSADLKRQALGSLLIHHAQPLAARPRSPRS